MKPYVVTTNKTFFGNDWYGKVKNIPHSKLRNKLKRKYDKDTFIEIQLFTTKSKKVIRRKIKEELKNEIHRVSI